MQLPTFKKSLFGYRKEDVYKYFDELSKEFSRRLQKSEDQAEQRIAELQKRNAELRQRIEELTQENAEYKKNEAAVSGSIIEAKRFAETIRSGIEMQTEQQREELQREFLVGKSKAEAVLKSVAACQAVVAEQLKRIQADLDEAQASAERVIEAEEENIIILEQSKSSEKLSLFSLK